MPSKSLKKKSKKSSKKSPKRPRSAPKKRTGKKSLYHRLGGIYSISAVVEHFSDALIKNKVVGINSDNPELRDWSRNKQDRLPGLKFMRTLWLCDVAGGPYTFIPTVPGKCPLSLENAHKKF